MSSLIDQLKEIVGPKGFRQGEDIDGKNYVDIMRARKVLPTILLRPETTEQVSLILKCCCEAGQAVAVQGGMTGLVSAAAPCEGEVSISLERMKKIIEVDPLTSTITVEAGIELQTVQETADSHNLLYPLDLGARGSCTIGGNLATNAGGNRVIRYGMTRDLVLGVEAVLADGTILNGLNKLRKNNTGYDLKQLFIGSEGTLGVITKVVLKLVPKPETQSTAFCAVDSFDQVSNFLLHAQKKLTGNLTAFEVMWCNAYQLIGEHVKRVTLPLEQNYQFYVLLESMGSGGDSDKSLFENVLASALENELISDAVISQSSKDVSGMWEIRDAVTELSSGVGYMHTYDISVNISDMGYFGEEVVKRLTDQWEHAIIALFGHIGDGNLHINVNVGADTRNAHHQIDEIIYNLVSELGGAISAEHGIGMMKKDFLGYSRSEPEIELMKKLKQSLDPKGILNPGRII